MYTVNYYTQNRNMVDSKFVKIIVRADARLRNIISFLNKALILATKMFRLRPPPHTAMDY